MKHTAALCLTVVGCSTLQEDKGVSENRDIKFSASIGSFQVKATDTAFENGDAMGLFAEDPVAVENVRLTWQDGALTPETPVQWGWDQLVDESALFAAYYPYTAEPAFREGGDYDYLEFTVQTDQSTHAAYTASDLMTASTYATPAEGTVNFAFVHRMSKLVLTVDNRLEDPVKEVYVGNVQATGYINIVKSQDYYTDYVDAVSIKAGEGVTTDGTKAWSVIIPAQNCQITLMLVTESGKEYVYKSEHNVYFAAARRHTAHVILDETAISTTFSATVYDWMDNGDFWFKQPNSLLDGEWTMIGSFGGSNWDRDLAMNHDGNTWYAEVILHAGNEFKFRKDYAWEVDFGAQEGSTVSGNWGTINLVQAGRNFIVEEDGIYSIALYLDDGYMYFWKTGELPAVEGTQIWSGAKLLEGWDFDEKNGYFGDEDVWVKEGLKVGDEIRVYYERNQFVYMGYWNFLVAPKTWNVQANYSSNEYNYSYGYVSLYVTEQWYKELTDVQGWGGALVCIGEGVVITAISFGEPSTPPATNGWSLIGSIMGSSWDKDFEMTSYADMGYDGSWSIEITYNEGDEFKFRKNGNWSDGDLGAGSDWTVTEDGNYAMVLSDRGKNIMLPQAGQWLLWLDTNNKTLSATYQETK